MSETSPIGLMSRVDKIAVGSCGVVVPNTECKIGKEKKFVKSIFFKIQKKNRILSRNLSENKPGRVEETCCFWGKIQKTLHKIQW